MISAGFTPARFLFQEASAVSLAQAPSTPDFCSFQAATIRPLSSPPWFKEDAKFFKTIEGSGREQYVVPWEEISKRSNVICWCVNPNYSEQVVASSFFSKYQSENKQRSKLQAYKSNPNTGIQAESPRSGVAKVLGGGGTPKTSPTRPLECPGKHRQEGAKRNQQPKVDISPEPLDNDAFRPHRKIVARYLPKGRHS